MRSELVAGRPSAFLRPYVRAFHGWVEETGAPVRRAEFSYGDVVLIVNLEAPVRIRDPRRPQSVAAPRAFVGGIDDSYALTEHDGRSSGIQVTLSPFAARGFLGVPMRELARATIDLEDVIGAEARRLVNAVGERTAWEERFAVLDRAIAGRVADAPPPPPDTVRAWRRLTETHGALRVEALARELGCSRRHLAARFGDHVGLTPKTVARILRFRHAVRLMLRHSARWGDVAFDCGYSDQPHLNREFRQFVGANPSAYLERAAAVTYLQDPGDSPS